MIMWIAALVLVALTAGIGYRQGAIRAAFTFVGLVVAAILAIPLTPAFAWIFPLIGFKQPVVAQFGAPIIAFFVVSFVFKAIAAVVHRKVDYHYRYNRQDAERAVWEVMHRRVGACVGVLNGVIYFFVFAIIIAVFGYFTIQTGGADSGSKVLSFVGKAAADLQNTHMDKVVAPFNPAGERYMDAADITGLIYHNRGLVDRLYNYPVFAAMAEQPIYKDLGKDRDLQRMLKGQSTLSEILDNRKVQEVISNTDLVTKVMELDYKDLKQYLETGASPKFEQEKILGQWRYDELASLQLNRNLKPEVPASTWFRVKNELIERFDNSVFTAFYDNTAKLLLATNMDGKASPMLPGARLPNGQTNYIAKWFTTNPISSATGKWSGSAPNYLVTLGNKTAEAKLGEGRLSFQFQDKALSFVRQPD
jgi:hypothetical protein